MRLPAFTPRKLIKVLKKAGFIKARQTGSHLFLLHKNTKRIVVIPIHPKDLKRGLLVSIFKQAGLPIKDFTKLLRKGG